MYTPKQFLPGSSNEVFEFIRENAFGILISNTPSGMIASHVPLLLAEDNENLYGHIARANPQWKDFISTRVLAIFNGPHSYISSSWYDHENVPTWNYMAAHVYGTFELTSEQDTLSALSRMVDKYEAGSEEPAKVSSLSTNFLQQSLRGLSGFRIVIERIECSFKLSQNRDEKNLANIVSKLRHRNKGHDSQIADEMLRARRQKMER